MDRKNDDSRLLLEQVNDLLENNKVLELRELLEEYHTMDILDVMENLDVNIAGEEGCFRNFRTTAKTMIF